MPVSGRRFKALQQQHQLDVAELETVRAELDEALQKLDSSRKLVTTLMHSPATTAEQRLRAELRRSEEARQALDVRITVLQAANEGAYREAYDLAKTAREVIA